MKKFINKAHVEGWLHDHTLQLRETGPNSKNPGTEYIAGDINIATDDEMTNVIPVHFTYVTATTSKGSPNATFGTLKDIIEGRLACVVDKGQDAAAKFRVDTSIGLNEFYTNRDGEDRLVSAKRYDGGFIHTTPTLADKDTDRNYFDVDILITNVSEKEPDEERGLPAKAVIKGCVFDTFRKSILPVELETSIPGAMDYFTGLGATSKAPVFTRVRGQQLSTTVIRKIEEASAFGDTLVREVKNTRKEFAINWAQGDVYEWDTEETLTAAELTEMMAARELYVADIKKRNDEYQASKKTTTSAAPAGGQEFKF